jgi:guanine deaminase
MSQSHSTIVRGPLLNPRSDQTADWFPDGAIAAAAGGKISFIGDWAAVAPHAASAVVRQSDGVILPPLIDAHIHIPQFPIRGKFLEGVGAHPEGGRLLAGLNRNVFPTEARCSDAVYTERVVRDFLADTLSKGVVGGAAYMTVHAQAARIALEILPETWSVGLVLMNQHCPPDLRTDEANLDRDITELAERFGRRLIVTDRFAPVVDSPLRRRAAKLAEKFGLRMQTHLNEQIAEKEFVEKVMYPNAGTYTDVYRTDGLLAREPILAHCIRMSDAEFAMVAAAPGALIAHCPTSNMLLGSGVMPLEKVRAAGIDYAICTDVGASPTTSLLAEAAQFLTVHQSATLETALFRITHAPAAALGLADELGSFDIGKPLSFIEIDVEALHPLRNFAWNLNDDLRAVLEELAAAGLDAGEQSDSLDRHVWNTARILDSAVARVTVQNRETWKRKDLSSGDARSEATTSAGAGSKPTPRRQPPL